MGVLFRTTSDYHEITVDDDQAGAITLRIGGRRQSTLDTATGLDAVQPIIDYLHIPIALRPDARSALLVGLGGGVLAKRMWHDYPALRIDVVELDPVVVDVAHRFFGLPKDDPRLTVHIGDGVRFVNEAEVAYDLIIIDAYFVDAMPFDFATEEFFAAAADRLSPRGVLAYNIVSTSEGDSSTPLRRILSGIGRHFEWAGLFLTGVDCGAGRQNMALVASRSPLDEATVRQSIATRAGGLVTVGGFETFGGSMIDGLAMVRGAEPYRHLDAPEDGFLRT